MPEACDAPSGASNTIQAYLRMGIMGIHAAMRDEDTLVGISFHYSPELTNASIGTMLSIKPIRVTFSSCC